MDCHFAYELIGLGAMDIKFQYEHTGFGAMDGQLPHEFIGFGLGPWMVMSHMGAQGLGPWTATLPVKSYDSALASAVGRPWARHAGCTYGLVASQKNASGVCVCVYVCSMYVRARCFSKI